MTQAPPTHRPITLAFERVHARDRAGDKGRTRGALVDVSVALGPGVTAILGSPEDGTIAFTEVASGARRPARGKAVMLGRDLARSPAFRGRTGVLAPEPRLPSARTVAAAVRLAMAARGQRAGAIDSVLDPLGLSALHARRLRSLVFAEARAIELALALSTPAPLLVVLHEPLADIALADKAFVRQRVREIAAAGACVLVTTSSPADARALADRILVLHAGSIAREVGPDGVGFDGSVGVDLVAWIRASTAAQLFEVAGALGRDPSVRGVAWEEPPGDSGDAAVLRIATADVEASARALVDAALAADVLLEALAPATPELAVVRAATDAMLRARANPHSPPPLPPAAFHAPPPSYGPPANFGGA